MMAILNRKKMGGGMLDVIRCDEPNYLVWKWHPSGTDFGENRKENSVKWGSSIRVTEGSVAVFFYNGENGSTIEYIEGPYDGFLETKNLPIIADIIGIAYDGETPFQAEVYFINLAHIIQFKFAVPYFDVYDPRYEDFGVPTAVRGTATFRITDYKQFIKLHRLSNYGIEDLKEQVRAAVSRYTKDVVANAPMEHDIPLVQIERKLSVINRLVEEKIIDRLYQDFGITVSGIDLEAIEVDKESQGYKELKKLTVEQTTKTVEARTKVNIKEMKAAQTLSVFDRAGRMFVDIKEDGYARHQKIKKENSLRESVASTGTKMAEGIGAGISSVVNSLKKGKAIDENTPPPIPTYSLVIDGNVKGGYDIDSLVQLYLENKINKDTLVWKRGMEDWAKAGTIDELVQAFSEIHSVHK